MTCATTCCCTRAPRTFFDPRSLALAEGFDDLVGNSDPRRRLAGLQDRRPKSHRVLLRRADEQTARPPRLIERVSARVVGSGATTSFGRPCPGPRRRVTEACRESRPRPASRAPRAPPVEPRAAHP